MKGPSILRGTPVEMAREARRHAGKSQRQIQNYHGITRTQIARYENGHHDFMMRNWLKLVEACGYEVVLVRKGAKVCSLSDLQDQPAVARTRLPIGL